MDRRRAKYNKKNNVLIHRDASFVWDRLRKAGSNDFKCHTETNVHSVARRRRQGSDRAAIYTLEAEQLNNNR